MLYFNTSELLPFSLKLRKGSDQRFKAIQGAEHLSSISDFATEYLLIEIVMAVALLKDLLLWTRLHKYQ